MGEATAYLLAKKGVKMVITYFHGQDKADRILQKVKELGSEAASVKADGQSVNDMRMVVDFTVKTYGKIDIFVHLASTIAFKPMKDHTEEDFDNSFNTNVKGLHFSMVAAGEKMEPNGRIVTVGSTQSTLVAPLYGNVCLIA